MKIIYFDVENYEVEFLQKNTKFDFLLDEKSLNDLNPIEENYKNADIISVFTTSKLSSNVLKQFKNLKLIALRSVGFNHVDIEYCKSNNIAVVNSPNYGNITVAEFALALLLDVCRKVTLSYTEYKNAKVCPNTLMGLELYGKTVGIIGLGAIGSSFARIMHGLGLNIIAYDKTNKKDLIQNYNVKYVDFDTLLKNSDFISIHAPLTNENYHMFDEKAFKKMKKNAIIINTGRGELINIQALYNALIKEEIAGAGLDVLENEEAITQLDYMNGINRMNKLTLQQTIFNSKLFQMDNVIITPHMAYNTKEAIHRILEITINNIENFALGKIQNSVY